MPILETERLILRPLILDDAPAIQSVFPDWRIVRWMTGSIPWPYPEDGAVNFIAQVVLPAVAAGVAWHWSIRPKTDPGRLIGVISLTIDEDDNRGFWLDPEWQGRGLMTEASDIVTDHWFGTLGMEILRVPKAVGNPPSRRLSEKRGMRVVRRFQANLVSGFHEIEVWEIDRATWCLNRAASNQ